VSDELRVGLVGYGLAGEVFHAPLVAATSQLRLAAVVTSNPERGDRVRRDHPGAAVLARADELWERAGELDVAVIATPNRSHAELGAAALDAGLHVVVDKPLAATAAAGRELVELAEERDRLLTVFHNRRFDGDFLTVRRLLEEDALGRVFRFESRFERWRPELAAGTWRELGSPEEAGGVLFDLGSHLIDQAVVLFGPPTRVYAELDVRRPGAEVDDDAFVALSHEGGVRSHLWMSQSAAQPGPRMRVLGSRAAYVKRGLDGQEAALRAGARPGEPDWGREPPELWGLLGSEPAASPVETEPGDYPRFYSGFAAAVRGGAEPPVDPRDGVAVLELIEAAIESARSGRLVYVG
jgi:scyllo-inositol 2-dehydrogenase (NADP+)